MIKPGDLCDCIFIALAIEPRIEPKAPNMDAIAFHKPGTNMINIITIATIPLGIAAAAFLSSAIKNNLTLNYEILFIEQAFTSDKEQLIYLDIVYTI